VPEGSDVLVRERDGNGLRVYEFFGIGGLRDDEDLSDEEADRAVRGDAVLGCLADLNSDDLPVFLRVGVASRPLCPRMRCHEFTTVDGTARI